MFLLHAVKRGLNKLRGGPKRCPNRTPRGPSNTEWRGQSESEGPKSKFHHKVWFGVLLPKSWLQRRGSRRGLNEVPVGLPQRLCFVPVEAPALEVPRCFRGRCFGVLGPFGVGPFRAVFVLGKVRLVTMKLDSGSGSAADGPLGVRIGRLWSHLLPNGQRRSRLTPIR